MRSRAFGAFTSLLVKCGVPKNMMPARQSAKCFVMNAFKQEDPPSWHVMLGRHEVGNHASSLDSCFGHM
jgi:hypothetical protein